MSDLVSELQQNKALLSDESKFNTRKQLARLKVNGRVGEANTPQNIVYTFFSRKFSCSVWGESRAHKRQISCSHLRE